MTNPADLLKRIQSGKIVGWELEKDGFKIKTDGSEDGHRRALEALSMIISDRVVLPRQAEQPQYH
jgi:hypothetical protein